MRTFLRSGACLVVTLFLLLFPACNSTSMNGSGNEDNTGSSSKPVSIRVNGVFPVGMVGVAYPAQSSPVLMAPTGSAPFTWAVNTGNLPPGLKLSEGSSGTGAIVSGTPTTAGTFTFTVQVEDSNSSKATQAESITIDAALAITTQSLPNGTVGANYSAAVNGAGGAAPYVFSVASGTLPPGLNLNGSTGTVTGSPTTAGTFGFAVQVKDSNGNASSASFSVTMEPPLAVTTTSLSGTAGVAYTGQLAASGGFQPYANWTVISGTLPSGLVVNSNGSITGTPVGAAGTSTFTVQVTDSFSPAPNTASGTVTLTINPGTGVYACGSATGNESMLSAGSWAFLLSGFDSTGNAVAVAGSFAADGKGGISGGEEDSNDASPTVGPAHVTISNTGSAYSLGQDGRGCLVLSTSAATSATYSFVLSSTNAGKGRIMEFDDANNTAGTAREVGILRRQTTSAFLLTQLQPNYAFGLSGWDATPDPFAVIGSFALDNSTGAITSGVADADDGGSVITSISPITGTMGPAVSASTGRCTAVFNAPSMSGNFATYVVSQNQFFVINIDVPGAGVPLTSGQAIATGNSFTNASLAGTFIARTAGYDYVASPAAASVTIGQVTFNSASDALTGELFQDQAGTSFSTGISSGSYSIDPVSGRVAFTGIASNATLAFAYVTTPTDGISAFAMGSDNGASAGILQAQAAGPYSLAGNYIVGTSQMGDALTVAQIGSIDFNADAGVGVVDQSQSGANGLLVNQALSQTYSINSDGTATAAANTAAVTNGNTIYFVDETPGKDPSILVIEQ